MSRRRWSQAGPPIVAVLLLIIVWQLAVTIFEVGKWMLPGPIDIVNEAIASAPSLLKHTWATLQLTLIGFGCGAVVGLVVAMLLHPIPLVKRAIYPIIIVSQNIPTIALLPLLMIWFGFGLMPKIVVITLVCFFPITIAMMDGLMQTDRTMLHYMRMAGATRAQLFWKLELPHAMPAVFSGLKIAATYSVMSAIVAEWLGTDKGIGYYMVLQKAAFRTDRMFVAIAIVVLMSITMFSIVQAIERRVVHWQAARSHQRDK
ncbi:ABC transporter permease [Paenibacillus sp. ACRRX]|uniref:ABC transporter permease n=1 Tax=unclassified Paenibacillus TaxID=185978 RepID=UPI001EF5BB86|nr:MULTISPECIES: ABC transporter permease [unclassified Paenibacillus]MCG7408107.1 ABC transporter permease [Paenibacillus sp. ACRRX]MDK8181510.1 ABC transporter permease [Paenibacillus sp. UMB4589-SE434]